MTSTSTSRTAGVAILGGGLAGQRCAETLRRHGYDGAIRIVCAEAHRPYDRPPLSKRALREPADVGALAFRPLAWYQEHAVELLLGASATELRPRERAARLSDGRTLRFDWALIATGSRPRPLPALAGRENVSTLRDFEDCQALREALAQPTRLAVIGAGFVGQEVAATARGLGAEVTLIEAGPCPLAAILGEGLGGWFSRLHRDEGVRVLCGVTVRRVRGRPRVRELELSDGRRVEVDHVVVGVGVTPATSWLRGSGLLSDGGVPVDEHGRSRFARVLAAGDAAAAYDPRRGRHVPGAHWETAARQGARAAQVMLGRELGPPPISSFWSDQYGIRIQYVGHARLGERIVLDGDPETRSFTATFTRSGRPVAALLIDRPRELAPIRDLIEKGES